MHQSGERVISSATIAEMVAELVFDMIVNKMGNGEGEMRQ